MLGIPMIIIRTAMTEAGYVLNKVRNFPGICFVLTYQDNGNDIEGLLDFLQVQFGCDMLERVNNDYFIKQNNRTKIIVSVLNDENAIQIEYVL